MAPLGNVNGIPTAPGAPIDASHFKRVTINVAVHWTGNERIAIVVCKQLSAGYRVLGTAYLIATATGASFVPVTVMVNVANADVAGVGASSSCTLYFSVIVDVSPTLNSSNCVPGVKTILLLTIANVPGVSVVTESPLPSCLKWANDAQCTRQIIHIRVVGQHIDRQRSSVLRGRHAVIVGHWGIVEPSTMIVTVARERRPEESATW